MTRMSVSQASENGFVLDSRLGPNIALQQAFLGDYNYTMEDVKLAKNVIAILDQAIVALERANASGSLSEVRTHMLTLNRAIADVVRCAEIAVMNAAENTLKSN